MLEKRIINGVDAKEGEYPFVAHLLYSHDSDSVQCVGTIVHEQLVMVPAYCVTHHATNRAVDPSELLVGYGSVERKRLKHAKVLDLVVNSNYVSREMTHDIALIQVEPLDFGSPAAGRIPIYTGSVEPNLMLHVMGWGVTVPGTSEWAERLKATGVRVGHPARCSMNRNYNGVEGRVICTDNQLHPNHDLCDGEFGAPLVIEDDGELKLVGTYSYHIDLSPEGYTVCAKNSSLAYYTHAYSYLDFLAAVSGLPPDSFTTPWDAPSAPHASPSKALVAGIVCGAIGFVVGLAIVLVFVWRKIKERQRLRWGYSYELASRAPDAAAPEDGASDDASDGSIQAILPAH